MPFLALTLGSAFGPLQRVPVTQGHGMGMHAKRTANMTALHLRPPQSQKLQRLQNNSAAGPVGGLVQPAARGYLRTCTPTAKRG